MSSLGYSFNEEIQCKNSTSKNINPQSSQDEFVQEVPKTIRAIQNFIQKKQTNIKPYGEGTYSGSVEKDSEGKTTASGSIGYETDNGTKFEGKASVDNEGNISRKVSVSGTF